METVVARIAEPLPTAAALVATFAGAGLRLGAAVTIEADTPMVTVGVCEAGGILGLPHEIAPHVLVTIDAPPSADDGRADDNSA